MFYRLYGCLQIILCQKIAVFAGELKSFQDLPLRSADVNLQPRIDNDLRHVSC